MSDPTSLLSTPVVQFASEDPTAVQVRLDEFCTRLSVSERRPEPINAFYADQMRAGRAKDTEAAYASRFQIFLSKPL